MNNTNHRVPKIEETKANTMQITEDLTIDGNTLPLTETVI